MLTFGDQGAALVAGAAGPYSVLPSAVADNELARGLAWARRLIAEDRSPGTIDKYMRDWALFVHWLGAAMPERDPCPAHSAVVGLYIGVLVDRKLTKQTILGRIAAIAYVHDVAGASSPLLEPTLRRQIRGLRRTNDGDRQARPAIERAMATEMIDAVPGGEGQSLRNLRDRAIFALGWLSALRRSNIAALRRRDVTIARDDLHHRRYLDIFIAKSKTDQERRGKSVVVNELPLTEPLCAVRAIQAWLIATPDVPPDGPLFPTFIRSGRRLTDHAIDGKDVSRVVKRMAALAGFDAQFFAAHGLRRGFATSAINKGVRKSVVREHGGWKSDAMLDRYTRVDQSRDNAVTDLFND
jgi:integrase